MKQGTMQLKTGLLLTLFLFTLQATRIKDLIRNELKGIRNIKYRHFLKSMHPARQLTASRNSFISTRHWVKRSSVFNTRVKLCPEENIAEVMASHKAYYKLRVCQKAVWEAFQIFLDRIPDTMEYQQWLGSCQKDSLCIDDLAQNFSSNREHIDMVARTVLSSTETIQDQPESALAMSVPRKKCSETSEEPHTVESEKTRATTVEHIIELSGTLKDPANRESLTDSDTLLYQEVTQGLREQMLQIFRTLPGFKKIHLVGIQPGAAAVRYALVFETEADSTRTGSSGNGGISGTEVSLKDMVSKALQKETSLPLDITSLSFESNNTRYLPMEPTESISISKDDVSPNETHAGRYEEAVASTTKEVIKHSLPVTTLMSITELPPSEAGFEGSITLDYSKISAVQQNPQNKLVTSRSLNFNSFKEATSEENPVDLIAVSEASETEELSDIPYFSPTEVSTVKTAVGPMDIYLEAHELNNHVVSTKVPSGSEPADLTESFSVPSHEYTIQSVQSDPIPEPIPAVDIHCALPMTSENILGKEGHQKKACDIGDYGNGLPPKTDDTQFLSSSLDTSTSSVADNHASDLLMVFSLQVTNTIFSRDLLNKRSPEYKSLENTFLELRQFSGPHNLANQEDSSKQTEREQRTLASIPLLPYLQSNLTGFKELHILSYRNGSVVVNSTMKLPKPVVNNVTKTVLCMLDDNYKAASSRLDTEINAQSADVAPAKHSDPCEYMDCKEFSQCVVNALTTEAECLCDPGYVMVDGLSCQSICKLQPDYCLNEGLCDNVPGNGVTCRCPVGKYWYYQGAQCDELVYESLDPFLFVIYLVGSLSVVCAVIGTMILINKKCIRTRKTITLVHGHSHSSLPLEGIMRVNPVFEYEDGTLSHVSSISYPKSTDCGSSHLSDQDTFQSDENMLPSIKSWWLSNEHTMKSCLSKASDREGIEVTIL